MMLVIRGSSFILTPATPGGESDDMDKTDFDYYRARIAEEEIAAQRAAHPLAAESHRRLAEEYASLIVALEDVPERHHAHG